MRRLAESALAAEENHGASIQKMIPVIGVQPAELRWLRMLIFLLRHPDPAVAELARQALLYLTEAAGDTGESGESAEPHACCNNLVS